MRHYPIFYIVWAASFLFVFMFFYGIHNTDLEHKLRHKLRPAILKPNQPFSRKTRSHSSANSKFQESLLSGVQVLQYCMSYEIIVTSHEMRYEISKSHPFYCTSTLSETEYSAIIHIWFFTNNIRIFMSKS